MRALCVVALFTVAGCGGAVVRPTGKVTLKGQPVGGVELRFDSDAAPNTPITGRSNADGTYQLDYGQQRGLAVGRSKITIAHYTLKNGKPLPDGEDGATLRNQPEKVTKHIYEFEKDIPEKTTELNFELGEGKKSIEDPNG
jgi:hypothetical protein